MARTAPSKIESATSGRRRGKRASVPQAGDPTVRAGSSPRAERQAQRREAILAAALDEFSARGFAATRLDDVAKRADVAKGTIYLYFHDKEALFEELIRTAIVPLVARMTAPPSFSGSVRDAVEGIARTFIQEVTG